VHQAVSNHLVFPLEALAALAPQAALDGTEVRANRAMNVFMRTTFRATYVSKVNIVNVNMLDGQAI
jgi:hypothetical protein